MRVSRSLRKSTRALVEDGQRAECRANTRCCCPTGGDGTAVCVRHLSSAGREAKECGEEDPAATRYWAGKGSSCLRALAAGQHAAQQVSCTTRYSEGGEALEGQDWEWAGGRRQTGARPVFGVR